VFGDSTKTIPKYISLYSYKMNTYEMCHLDGGHTEDIFSKDYENVKILLNKNGIVIFDDYHMESIYHYLNRKLYNKEIYLDDDVYIKKNNKQCIYKYS
jgi:Methyltransferase domain